ncbi:hypothetical protein ASE14_15965 [Agromyces sp. Root81]|uniref:GntR family transcriptional regulator n=1 Tax=Agromyces sp. Root81 TaxID=1736601 RepID=UPI0006F631E1|nr:GntR family transcriptional regulator [Agromyces sp. Root81]KRC59257.1 hypothetical protein ASE14_15965 [Agromyces sp. Root81]
MNAARENPTTELGARSNSRVPGLAGLDAPRQLRRPGASRGRISDYVYDELCEAIRYLRLEPGAALSEPAVAAWLNVSRAPVREAFARLVEHGLVSVVPQVGSQVAPISMREVGDAVFIRNALETSAFQQAIGTADLDTTRIQQLVDENREAAARNDIEAFFETDEQLHHQVFTLAGVPHLWQFIRGTKLQLDRLRRMNLEAAIANEEIVHEHQQIVDALARRDEAVGVQVIHQHSSRILVDTEKLRDEFPDYFES